MRQYFSMGLWGMVFPHSYITLDRWQSKTLSTIDELQSKIDINSVFDCHLSPVGRQMAIESTVSIDFLSPFLDSIGVFDCLLPRVYIRSTNKGPDKQK